MADIATTEMYRLKGSRAWSPLAPYAKRERNQYRSKYTFPDGSALSVYNNGDASWHSKEYGEQRWPNWHSCNVAGKTESTNG